MHACASRTSRTTWCSAVAAAARKTVVVVNAATPVLMPWLDEVDAVLWAGLPGQEGGHAVAAALLGDIEPAGRLVTTFPVEDGATPRGRSPPSTARCTYAEGTFIGYRGHYAGRAPAPAFWFGHGLGYSTWDYSDAGSCPTRRRPDGRGTVTNTGARPSREVVQVYFEPVDAGQPMRLVGWESLDAAAGESVDVSVTCERRLWRRWETGANTWTTLPDDGRLIIARGLGDIRATVALS